MCHGAQTMSAAHSSRDRGLSLRRDQSSCVKRHLGSGDEQSASSETAAGHAELSGEGTAQKAVGDEAERGLTELLDASETRKPELTSEISSQISH